MGRSELMYSDAERVVDDVVVKKINHPVFAHREATYLTECESHSWFYHWGSLAKMEHMAKMHINGYHE